jgi:hypothetical protein
MSSLLGAVAAVAIPAGIAARVAANNITIAPLDSTTLVGLIMPGHFIALGISSRAGNRPLRIILAVNFRGGLNHVALRGSEQRIPDVENQHGAGRVG